MVTIAATRRLRNQKEGPSSVSAWLIWLGVHIFNLIGFRNRLVVINWAWDYLFYERRCA
jgi:NADH dehydrogenase